MRKICVVTATRAEYGLLRCLLKKIEADEALELQLLVTGTHLSPEFGYTIEQIKNDAIPIAREIEILMSSDSEVGVCKGMGLALISFGEVFNDVRPDLVLVLGDRYELLPVVSAANIFRIPVAHMSGGELTEGAIDEVIRHSITKMSHLHFTAMDEYTNRVIQMGESPERVFTVGEVGLDNINSLELLSKEKFEDSIEHSLLKKNLLITYHPETTRASEDAMSDFDLILQALDKLEDTLLIFTKANADVGGRAVNACIDTYVAEHSNKAIAFNSLGQLRYLSALQYVDAVVGNSSSGIVEAPTFKVPTLNIGDRQKGRISAESVVDVPIEVPAILDGFRKIYSKEFQAELGSVVNPYGDGNSSQDVVSILKSVELSSLSKKKFHDIKVS